MAEQIEFCRLARFLLLTPAFLAMFFSLPAGDWQWERGWLFLLVFLASSVAASLYLRRVNPDLLAARINRHAGTEAWDKVLVGLLVASWVAVLPVAALDDGRFHWCPVPWGVCLLGYVLYLAGTAIMTRAQAVNKFFEPTVRLQEDRGQRVIDSGPYAVVRHRQDGQLSLEGLLQREVRPADEREPALLDVQGQVAVPLPDFAMLVEGEPEGRQRRRVTLLGLLDQGSQFRADVHRFRFILAHGVDASIHHGRVDNDPPR